MWVRCVLLALLWLSGEKGFCQEVSKALPEVEIAYGLPPSPLPGSEFIPSRNTRKALKRHRLAKEKDLPANNISGTDIVEPVPLNLEALSKLIVYPEIALACEFDGLVWIRVLIDEDGNYRTHKVIRKTHAVFVQAVSEQIPKLKFKPALQAGKPIPFWVNIPFNFRIGR